MARVQLGICNFKASNVLLLHSRGWHISALLYLLVLVSDTTATERFHTTQNKQSHVPLFWQWFRLIMRKAHLIIFSSSSFSSFHSPPPSSYFFSLLNYLRICWLNSKSALSPHWYLSQVSDNAAPPENHLVLPLCKAERCSSHPDRIFQWSPELVKLQVLRRASAAHTCTSRYSQTPSIECEILFIPQKHEVKTFSEATTKPEF